MRAFLLLLSAILISQLLLSQTNVANMATLSISSSFQPGWYEASDLIDGNTDPSEWADAAWYSSYADAQPTVTFDFGGSPIAIAEARVFGHNTASVRPNAHQLEASNSASGPWTTLYTESSIISSGQNTYNFTNTTNYRYYRVVVTTKGSNNVGGFQEIELYQNPTPLPVEFEEFSAVCIDGIVNLDWSTATEKDNSHFEVETSQDLNHFYVVSEIGGSGTTNNRTEYSEFVILEHSNTHYIRLKQVDYDGKYDYSKVISVECNTDDNSSPYTYPSVVKDYLSVNIQESTDFFSYQIYCSDGELIKSEETYDKILDLSDLNKGSYMIYYVVDGIEYHDRFFIH